MPGTPIQYLNVTFLEDVVFGAFTVSQGTTIALQKDIARGLAKSLRINGPGDAANALFAGAVKPVIVSGTFAIGGTVTATMQPGWGANNVQWTRNGASITGATATTYVVTSDDAGTYLNCVAMGLSFIAAGGLVAGVPTGGGPLAYDGGNAFSVFPGDAITGGDSGSTFSLPPISGGSA